MKKSEIFDFFYVEKNLQRENIHVPINKVFELLEKIQKQNTVENQLKEVLSRSFNDIDTACNEVCALIDLGELSICEGQNFYEIASKKGFDKSSIFGQWFLYILDQCLKHQKQKTINLEINDILKISRTIANEIELNSHKRRKKKVEDVIGEFLYKNLQKINVNS